MKSRSSTARPSSVAAYRMRLSSSAISTIHPAALSFLSVVYMVAGPIFTAPSVDSSTPCMIR